MIARWKNLERKTRVAITTLVAGLFAGGAADTLLEGPNRPIYFIAGVVLALSLFVIRHELRWFYGIIELLFALYLLWDASAKGRGNFGHDLSDDFSKVQFSVVLIQMLGAIYVFIRGLDNLTQGHEGLRKWWWEHRS